MPSQSKSQQRFFGVVKAMQKGDIPKKGEAGKAAKTMKKKDVDDFASTKHDDLPEKKRKQEGFASTNLSSKKLKEFEKGRHKNAEVLGYKLAGTPDVKTKIGKLREFIEKTIKENVKLPIKVGDTVKMGKFKNKSVKVKTIGWNDKGDLLINGRPALKFRLVKEGKLTENEISSDKVKKLSVIVKELENASKMHKSQSERIDKILKSISKNEGKLNEGSDTFVNILTKFGFKKGARDWGGHQFFAHKSKDLYATYHPKGRSLVIEPKRGGKPVFDSARSNFSIKALLNYLQSPSNKFVSTEGKLNEKFDLKKLEDAIKMFQKKIAKQGNVTNARDEEHLKQLIKVYKDMGGRKIKEGKLTEDVYAIVDKFNQKKQDYDQVYFKDKNLNKVKKHLKKMGSKYGKMNLIKVKTNGKMSVVEGKLTEKKMDRRKAAEILKQIGGNRFIAMTGAKGFAFSDKYMSFKIGRNSKGINFVRIGHNAKDLYDMQFGFVSTKGIKVKKKVKDVYADMLGTIFTKYTGMHVRL